MGWDIDVACEYKDPVTNQWTIADDYTVYHSATDPDNEYIEIVDPLAQYRNYNLFRPLADIRNTQKAIDNEIKMWKDYEKTHRHSYYQSSVITDLITETKTPTAVLEATKGIPEDVSEPAKTIYRYEQGDDYYVDLETLCKFCQLHFELHQLNEFRNKAVVKYNNIVNMLKTRYPDAEPITKRDFRILYSFNC